MVVFVSRSQLFSEITYLNWRHVIRGTKRACTVKIDIVNVGVDEVES